MTRAASVNADSIDSFRRAMPWRALLDGRLQAQALETVRKIADALRSWPPAPDHPAAGDPGLGSGAAGLAVFFACLVEGLGEPEYEATARRFLERALDLAEEEAMLPSLYQGLAGVGWAAMHLRGRLNWPDLEATLAEIDEALLEQLRPAEWREDYGLTSGLVGLGVYALERLPAPAAVDCLE